MANDDKYKGKKSFKPTRKILREAHFWFLEPTKADLERLRKQVDDLGISDSLEDLDET
jgi:hypothetical protein